MIAEEHRMRDVNKSNVSCLVDYITNDQGKISRIGMVLTRNCDNDDPVLAATDMKITQMMNTRATGDKTYHFSVSFPPNEAPSPELLQKIEAEYVAALGLSAHQRIIVVHHDTDNVHMHIVINKIHPEKFTMNDPHKSQFKLLKTSERLEKKYDLKIVSHQPRKNSSRNKLQKMEAMSGNQYLASWIEEKCLPELQTAGTWAEIHRICEKYSLELKERGNGLVFTNGEITMKASTVARELSKAKLELKLGDFVAPVITATEKIAEQPAQKSPNEKYEKKPKGENSDPLYREFELQKSIGKSRTTEFIDALKVETAKKKDVVRALCKAEINIIYANRRGRVWKETRDIEIIAAKIEQKTRLNAIDREYRTKKREFTAKFGAKTWIDWLKAQAETGRDDAVKKLRGRAIADAAINTAALSGEEIKTKKGEVIDREMIIDTVTKRGTVLYNVGGDVVRDYGTRITVDKPDNQETLIMSLKIAQKRFGEKLVIKGNDEKFKRAVIDAAVAGKLRITFNDAEMEKQRRELTQQVWQKTKTPAQKEQNIPPKESSPNKSIGIGR